MNVTESAMKSTISAAALAAAIALTGCIAKSGQESNVTLDGQSYKIIGAKRVEAKSNKKVSHTTDAQGKAVETAVTERTIVLDGKHTVTINDDGSFTVDGVKQDIHAGKAGTTIRVDGGKVIIE